MFPNTYNLNPPTLTCRMTYAAALRRIRSWKKAKNPQKWLNLSCLNLTELPPLPSNLRRLKCESNLLTSLNGLPKGLRILKCSATWIVNFKGLPKGLLSIECMDNDSLVSIDDIPDSVRYIKLESCNYIKKINHLPANLEKFIFWHAARLKYISYFPLKLRELSIGETSLKTIPILPNSLRMIEFYFTKINNLHSLPDSLEIFITNSSYLKKLPPLPESLHTLDIEGSGVWDLPIALPKNIKLFICNMPHLNIILAPLFSCS
jgi:hypothetical protein